MEAASLRQRVVDRLRSRRRPQEPAFDAARAAVLEAAILAREPERAWERLDWRTDAAVAAADARALDRPLFVHMIVRHDGDTASPFY